MAVHDEQGISPPTGPTSRSAPASRWRPSTIHFPTLEELVTACGSLTVERVEPPRPEDAEAALAGAASREERIERLAVAVFDFYERAGRIVDNVRRDRGRLPVLEQSHAKPRQGSTLSCERRSVRTEEARTTSASSGPCWTFGSGRRCGSTGSARTPQSRPRRRRSRLRSRGDPPRGSPSRRLTGAGAAPRLGSPSMGLRDVTGVLSRYFVLGYFVPAFATLFLLSQAVTDSLLPQSFERLGQQDRLLVVGVGALVAGLALQGLRYPVIRILEGYPFERGPLRPLRGPFVRLQQRSYDRLAEVRDDPDSRTARRPHACSTGGSTRSGSGSCRLASATPSARPRTTRTPAGASTASRSGRGSTCSSPTVSRSCTRTRCRILRSSSTARSAPSRSVSPCSWTPRSTSRSREWLWYLVPFAAAYSLYRAGVGAAERLGTERRASIDVHRRELYVRLGVPEPSAADERAVASAVNQFLLYGRELPARYRTGGEERSDGRRHDGDRQAAR